MSDLIRRKDVIKLVNQFVFGVRKEQIYEAKKTFIKYIEKMPTAYDIDKVVEELKQQAEQYRHRAFEVEKKGLSALADKYYGKQCSYEHAIEIVKQGGVSDDVCEWKYNDAEYYWESSCENLHIFMADGPKENKYEYCPYCGKKIKAVE